MSLQPISMNMSNLNVDTARHTPNAYAVAQDTGQRQEILQENIRIMQTVQASQEAAEAQRVHRKEEDNERGDKGRRGHDSFEHTSSEEKEAVKSESAPLLRETVISRKKIEFLA